MEDDPKTYTNKKPGWLFFIGSIAAVGVAVTLTAGLVRAQHIRLSHQTQELEEELEPGPRGLVKPVIWAPPPPTPGLPAAHPRFLPPPIPPKTPPHLHTPHLA